jgi:hypothetical protein
MKNIILSAAISLLMLGACATLSGKIGAGKIDKMSEQCLEENDALKPSTAKWHNLSTQERTKKKKEFNDYKKNRIELYQSLHSFKNLYLSLVDDDGKCRKKECKSLEKALKEIVSGCPTTSESFQKIASE